MKPTMKNLVLGASVLAFGLGNAAINNEAKADNSVMSAYVKDVDLQFPGSAAIVNVKNISGDKLASKVKLQAMENALGFEIDGMVQCAQDNDVIYSDAKVYFGTVVNNNGTINDAPALDSENATNVGNKIWGKISLTKKGWITEASNGTQLYEVPLNAVKNGHPALRVDPIAEIEKAAESFVNNGGTLADFYKQDREIVLQRPISLAGWCQKDGQKKGGYHTRNHTIQIKYQGDPAVYQVALNAQLANNNMPNQVQQNPDLPFQLNDATFQNNIPTYVGKCAPAQNPKIRVNFNIAGGKQGLIDLRVKAVSNQYADYGYYFETSSIATNPDNGNGHVDFSFPLKEMMGQQQYSYMVAPEYLNKTISHNMRIEARFKNFDGSNEWSQWKEFDQAVFKHRCTPQLNGQLQGMNNGGIQGYDNTPEAPKLDKIQSKPQRANSYLKLQGVKGEARD